MYKLLCGNLTKSHRSLTNFTGYYRKVAQKYYKAAITGKKYDSDTDLHGCTPADEKTDTGEAQDESTESEIPCEMESKSYSNFFHKNIIAKANLYPSTSARENRIVAATAISSRSFHSSNISHKRSPTDLKRPFKSKEAQEYYQTAIEQCMRIKYKLDKFYHQANLTSKPAKIIVELKRDLENLASSRKIQSMRFKEFRQQEEDKERRVAPEMTKIDRMKNEKDNFQFKQNKFRITYPTHTVRYKLGSFKLQHVKVKPHIISDKKALIPTNPSKILQKKRSEKELADEHALKFKQHRKRLPYITQCLKNYGGNENISEEERQRRKLEIAMIKKHPTVREANASVKMAFKSSYNKLLKKSGLLYQGPKDATVAADVAKKDAVTDGDSRKQFEPKPPAPKSSTWTYPKPDKTKDNTNNNTNEVKVLEHPLAGTKPVKIESTPTHPKRILSEKSETFDIDDMCLKSNAASNVTTNYGDYVIESEERVRNFVETYKEHPKAPKSEPKIKMESRESKFQVREVPKEVGKADSIGEYLKKLKELRDQTALDRSKEVKTQESKKIDMVQKVEGKKLTDNKTNKPTATSDTQDTARAFPKRKSKVSQEETKTEKLNETKSTIHVAMSDNGAKNKQYPISDKFGKENLSSNTKADETKDIVRRLKSREEKLRSQSVSNIRQERSPIKRIPPLKTVRSESVPKTVKPSDTQIKESEAHETRQEDMKKYYQREKPLKMIMEKYIVQSREAMSMAEIKRINRRKRRDREMKLKEEAMMQQQKLENERREVILQEKKATNEGTEKRHTYPISDGTFVSSNELKKDDRKVNDKSEDTRGKIVSNILQAKGPTQVPTEVLKEISEKATDKVPIKEVSKIPNESGDKIEVSTSKESPNVVGSTITTKEVHVPTSAQNLPKEILKQMNKTRGKLPGITVEKKVQAAENVEKTTDKAEHVKEIQESKKDNATEHSTKVKVDLKETFTSENLRRLSELIKKDQHVEKQIEKALEKVADIKKSFDEKKGNLMQFVGNAFKQMNDNKEEMKIKRSEENEQNMTKKRPESEVNTDVNLGKLANRTLKEQTKKPIENILKESESPGKAMSSEKQSANSVDVTDKGGEVSESNSVLEKVAAQKRLWLEAKEKMKAQKPSFQQKNVPQRKAATKELNQNEREELKNSQDNLESQRVATQKKMLLEMAEKMKKSAVDSSEHQKIPQALKEEEKPAIKEGALKCDTDLKKPEKHTLEEKSISQDDVVLEKITMQKKMLVEMKKKGEKSAPVSLEQQKAPQELKVEQKRAIKESEQKESNRARYWIGKLVPEETLEYDTDFETPEKHTREVRNSSQDNTALEKVAIQKKMLVEIKDKDSALVYLEEQKVPQEVEKEEKPARKKSVHKESNKAKYWIGKLVPEEALELDKDLEKPEKHTGEVSNISQDNSALEKVAIQKKMLVEMKDKVKKSALVSLEKVSHTLKEKPAIKESNQKGSNKAKYWIVKIVPEETFEYDTNMEKPEKHTRGQGNTSQEIQKKMLVVMKDEGEKSAVVSLEQETVPQALKEEEKPVIKAPTQKEENRARYSIGKMVSEETLAFDTNLQKPKKYTQEEILPFEKIAIQRKMLLDANKNKIISGGGSLRQQNEPHVFKEEENIGIKNEKYRQEVPAIENIEIQRKILLEANKNKIISVGRSSEKQNEPQVFKEENVGIKKPKQNECNGAKYRLDENYKFPLEETMELDIDKNLKNPIEQRSDAAKDFVNKKILENIAKQKKIFLEIKEMAKKSLYASSEHQKGAQLLDEVEKAVIKDSKQKENNKAANHLDNGINFCPGKKIEKDAEKDSKNFIEQTSQEDKISENTSEKISKQGKMILQLKENMKKSLGASLHQQKRSQLLEEEKAAVKDSKQKENNRLTNPLDKSINLSLGEKIEKDTDKNLKNPMEQKSEETKISEKEILEKVIKQRKMFLQLKEDMKNSLDASLERQKRPELMEEEAAFKDSKQKESLRSTTNRLDQRKNFSIGEKIEEDADENFKKHIEENKSKGNISENNLILEKVAIQKKMLLDMKDKSRVPSLERELNKKDAAVIEKPKQNKSRGGRYRLDEGINVSLRENMEQDVHKGLKKPIEESELDPRKSENNLVAQKIAKQKRMLLKMKEKAKKYLGASVEQKEKQPSKEEKKVEIKDLKQNESIETKHDKGTSNVSGEKMGRDIDRNLKKPIEMEGQKDKIYETNLAAINVARQKQIFRKIKEASIPLDGSLKQREQQALKEQALIEESKQKEINDIKYGKDTSDAADKQMQNDSKNSSEQRAEVRKISENNLTARKFVKQKEMLRKIKEETKSLDTSLEQKQSVKEEKQAAIKESKPKEINDMEYGKDTSNALGKQMQDDIDEDSKNLLQQRVVGKISEKNLTAPKFASQKKVMTKIKDETKSLGASFEQKEQQELKEAEAAATEDSKQKEINDMKSGKDTSNAPRKQLQDEDFKNPLEQRAKLGQIYETNLAARKFANQKKVLRKIKEATIFLEASLEQKEPQILKEEEIAATKKSKANESNETKYGKDKNISNAALQTVKEEEEVATEKSEENKDMKYGKDSSNAPGKQMQDDVNKDFKNPLEQRAQIGEVYETNLAVRNVAKQKKVLRQIKEVTKSLDAALEQKEPHELKEEEAAAIEEPKEKDSNEIKYEDDKSISNVPDEQMREHIYKDLKTILEKRAKIDEARESNLAGRNVRKQKRILREINEKVAKSLDTTLEQPKEPQTLKENDEIKYAKDNSTNIHEEKMERDIDKVVTNKKHEEEKIADAVEDSPQTKKKPKEKWPSGFKAFKQRSEEGKRTPTKVCQNSELMKTAEKGKSLKEQLYKTQLENLRQLKIASTRIVKLVEKMDDVEFCLENKGEIEKCRTLVNEPVTPKEKLDQILDNETFEMANKLEKRKSKSLDRRPKEKVEKTDGEERGIEKSTSPENRPTIRREKPPHRDEKKKKDQPKSKPDIVLPSKGHNDPKMHHRAELLKTDNFEEINKELMHHRAEIRTTDTFGKMSKDHIYAAMSKNKLVTGDNTKKSKSLVDLAEEQKTAKIPNENETSWNDENAKTESKNMLSRSETRLDFIENKIEVIVKDDIQQKKTKPLLVVTLRFPPLNLKPTQTPPSPPPPPPSGGVKPVKGQSPPDHQIETATKANDHSSVHSDMSHTSKTQQEKTIPVSLNSCKMKRARIEDDFWEDKRNQEGKSIGFVPKDVLWHTENDLDKCLSKLKRGRIEDEQMMYSKEVQGAKSATRDSQTSGETTKISLNVPLKPESPIETIEKSGKEIVAQKTEPICKDGKASEKRIRSESGKKGLIESSTSHVKNLDRRRNIEQDTDRKGEANLEETPETATKTVTSVAAAERPAKPKRIKVPVKKKHVKSATKLDVKKNSKTFVPHLKAPSATTTGGRLVKIKSSQLTQKKHVRKRASAERVSDSKSVDNNDLKTKNNLKRLIQAMKKADEELEQILKSYEVCKRPKQAKVQKKDDSKKGEENEKLKRERTQVVVKKAKPKEMIYKNSIDSKTYVLKNADGPTKMDSQISTKTSTNKSNLLSDSNLESNKIEPVVKKETQLNENTKAKTTIKGSKYLLTADSVKKQPKYLLTAVETDKKQKCLLTATDNRKSDKEGKVQPKETGKKNTVDIPETQTLLSSGAVKEKSQESKSDKNQSREKGSTAQTSATVEKTPPTNKTELDVMDTEILAAKTAEKIHSPISNEHAVMNKDQLITEILSHSKGIREDKQTCRTSKENDSTNDHAVINKDRLTTEILSHSKGVMEDKKSYSTWKENDNRLTAVLKDESSPNQNGGDTSKSLFPDAKLLIQLFGRKKPKNILVDTSDGIRDEEMVTPEEILLKVDEDVEVPGKRKNNLSADSTVKEEQVSIPKDTTTLHDHTTPTSSRLRKPHKEEKMSTLYQIKEEDEEEAAAKSELQLGKVTEKSANPPQLTLTETTPENDIKENPSPAMKKKKKATFTFSRSPLIDMFIKPNHRTTKREEKAVRTIFVKKSRQVSSPTIISKEKVVKDCNKAKEPVKKVESNTPKTIMLTPKKRPIYDYFISKSVSKPPQRTRKETRCCLNKTKRRRSYLKGSDSKICTRRTFPQNSVIDREICSKTNTTISDVGLSVNRSRSEALELARTIRSNIARTKEILEKQLEVLRAVELPQGSRTPTNEAINLNKTSEIQYGKGQRVLTLLDKKLAQEVGKMLAQDKTLLNLEEEGVFDESKKIPLPKTVDGKMKVGDAISEELEKMAVPQKTDLNRVEGSEEKTEQDCDVLRDSKEKASKSRYQYLGTAYKKVKGVLSMVREENNILKQNNAVEEIAPKDQKGNQNFDSRSTATPMINHVPEINKVKKQAKQVEQPKEFKMDGKLEDASKANSKSWEGQQFIGFKNVPLKASETTNRKNKTNKIHIEKIRIIEKSNDWKDDKHKLKSLSGPEKQTKNKVKKMYEIFENKKLADNQQNKKTRGQTAHGIDSKQKSEKKNKKTDGDGQKLTKTRNCTRNVKQEVTKHRWDKMVSTKQEENQKIKKLKDTTQKSEKMSVQSKSVNNIKNENEVRESPKIKSTKNDQEKTSKTLKKVSKSYAELAACRSQIKVETKIEKISPREKQLKSKTESCLTTLYSNKSLKCNTESQEKIDSTYSGKRIKKAMMSKNLETVRNSKISVHKVRSNDELKGPSHSTTQTDFEINDKIKTSVKANKSTALSVNKENKSQTNATDIDKKVKISPKTSWEQIKEKIYWDCKMRKIFDVYLKHRKYFKDKFAKDRQEDLKKVPDILFKQNQDNDMLFTHTNNTAITSKQHDNIPETRNETIKNNHTICATTLLESNENNNQSKTMTSSTSDNQPTYKKTKNLETKSVETKALVPINFGRVCEDSKPKETPPIKVTNIGVNKITYDEFKNTDKGPLKARIEEILKTNVKEEDKISRFNKNLLRHLKQRPSENLPLVIQRHDIFDICKPLDPRALDLYETPKHLDDYLAEELRKPYHKRSSGYSLVEKYNKCKSFINYCTTKEETSVTERGKEILKGPYYIEKLPTSRYKDKKTEEPPKPVTIFCDRLCLPSKKMSQVALKPFAEEETTLNKAQSEKIQVAPKIEENVLDKYKGLKITQMNIRRHRRRGTDETFLPMVFGLDKNDIKNIELKNTLEEAKKQIVEFRFELLRKLHKEFRDMYQTDVNKNVGRFLKVSKHYKSVIEKLEKGYLEGKKVVVNKEAKSMEELLGPCPKPSFENVSRYYNSIIVKRMKETKKEETDNSKETKNEHINSGKLKSTNNLIQKLSEKTTTLDSSKNKTIKGTELVVTKNTKKDEGKGKDPPNSGN